MPKINKYEENREEILKQRKVNQLIDRIYPNIQPHTEDRTKIPTVYSLPIYIPHLGVRYVPHHQTHFVLARKHQSESAGKTETTSFPVAL